VTEDRAQHALEHQMLRLPGLIGHAIALLEIAAGAERPALPGQDHHAQVLEVEDGVMLVGKGDKFQLWNPKRWQARRDADRAKMEAFVRGLTGGDA